MPTRINLLDWRAERRALRRRQFLLMTGLAAAASVAAVLLGMLVMDGAVDRQRQRNAYLQTQIGELDKQIQEIQELEKVRQNLLARMRVIEELQQSRSASVHFFDEIVNTLPDGIFLTGVKQSGNNVTIDGIAESNGRISAYMKNLDASPWFKEPRLVVIKTSDKNKLRLSEFQLQVTNLTRSGEPDQKAGKVVVQ
jgi:type IV pilus assembly protein PilN